MARSTYIYAVSRAGALATLAVFTVKHELVSWLVRHRQQYPVGFYHEVEVRRFPDGGGDGGTTLDLEELMRGR